MSWQVEEFISSDILNVYLKIQESTCSEKDWELQKFGRNGTWTSHLQGVVVFDERKDPDGKQNRRRDNSHSDHPIATSW
jgi:hypothetical protein